jgi:hypothetical protein
MAELFPNRRRRLRKITAIGFAAAALAACQVSEEPAAGPTTPNEWSAEQATPPASPPPPPAPAGPSVSQPGARRESAAKPPPPPDAPKTNCVNTLRACGYPDASNTGWQPTGAKLTTSGVDLTADAEFQILDDGAVIDSKDIRGCVSIKANNVTIKRSRVRCDSYFPIRIYEGFKNAVIEDTEIDGMNSGTTNAAVGFDNYTLRRANIHSLGEGPHMGGNVLIENSYVHDLASCDICHNDAVQSSGALDVVLRHNTFINDAMGKNAVVRIATEQGESHNFLVENNLLAGGNFAVQVRSQGHGFPVNVRVIGNRIVPTWRFGPFDVTDGTIETTGNYRDDTLEPVIAD